MPVTLQFVKDHHFYDGIVNFVSHGWPTHVDVVVPVDDGDKIRPQLPDVMTDDGYMLLGARPRGGVMLRPKDYSAFKMIARVTLPATAEQEAAFYGFLADQYGKAYDFLDVAGFAINKFSGPGDKFFCSMLALSAINVAKLLPQKPAVVEYECDPWDLFLIVSAFGPVEWIENETRPS